jgi:hypothetical protein
MRRTKPRASLIESVAGNRCSTDGGRGSLRIGESWHAKRGRAPPSAVGIKTCWGKYWHLSTGKNNLCHPGGSCHEQIRPGHQLRQSAAGIRGNRAWTRLELDWGGGAAGAFATLRSTCTKRPSARGHTASRSTALEFIAMASVAPAGWALFLWRISLNIAYPAMTMTLSTE